MHAMPYLQMFNFHSFRIWLLFEGQSKIQVKRWSTWVLMNLQPINTIENNSMNYAVENYFGKINDGCWRISGNHSWIIQCCVALNELWKLLRFNLMWGLRMQSFNCFLFFSFHWEGFSFRNEAHQLKYDKNLWRMLIDLVHGCTFVYRISVYCAITSTTTVFDIMHFNWELFRLHIEREREKKWAVLFW